MHNRCIYKYTTNNNNTFYDIYVFKQNHLHWRKKKALNKIASQIINCVYIAAINFTMRSCSLYK